jgi:PAS domain S-box-containing protein
MSRTPKSSLTGCAPGLPSRKGALLYSSISSTAPLWIVFWYVAVSAPWIYLSDKLVSQWASTPEQEAFWSSIKGGAFILLTAGMLWLLLRRTFGQLNAAQKALKKSERLYAVLSHVSETMARTNDIQKLYQELCRALVRDGGFEMAWVGLHNTETQEIVPVASEGDTTGYLKEVHIFADARPEGRGPGGQAFREGRACVSNDFSNDPNIEHWHAMVASRGYRATVSLPFRSGGRIRGLIVAYAREASFFGQDEVRLLERVADNLSFALDRVEQRRERQHVQEQALHWQRVFAEAEFGLTLARLDNDTYLEVNPCFARERGYAPEELAGRSLFTIYPPELHSEVKKRILEASQCGHLIYESIHQRKDGSRFPVFVEATVIKDVEGRPISRVAYTLDITLRKKAELEIRQLNRLLEQRVQERTAQLESANHELEAFSYSVSHDLRAPLRAIDGYATILAEASGSHLDAEGRELLGNVSAQAKRMSQLIDSLLAFSRTSRQPFHLTRVDLQSLARTVFAECTAQVPERRFDFTLLPLPPACGDPALLRQVLTNLISNAVKYTRPRPVAKIEIGGRVEGPENLYYIQDNGVGFDMRYVDKLFGVFQRLHSAEQFEGTGVGLALVQRILQRHKGRVWAKSQPDVGTTIFFTLPPPPPREVPDGSSGL